MKEKFSDYEGGFLNQEGEFEFEITEAELGDSSKGNPMWKFGVKSDVGSTTIWHSLSPKARWSFNNLIKACLSITTKEQINSFECDYETIGQDLVGKKFIGRVECQPYDKVIKALNDDGTYRESVEEKESYKIVEYKPL